MIYKINDNQLGYTLMSWVVRYEVTFSRGDSPLTSEV